VAPDGFEKSLAYWVAQLAGGAAAAYLVFGWPAKTGGGSDGGTPDIAMVNGRSTD